MASTYVNDLRLEEMATGDQSGTWGDTTNVNLELIAEAFSYGTEASFSSDADATTTIADGASDPARSLYLKVTSGASLTATRTLTIAPNTVSKIWIIENATSGSQSINISQGSGANVTIPNGDVKVIYTDGAGAGAAVVDAFTNLTSSGTITATNLAGTLTTAAQPNITSLGTLTGLTTTGDINFGDNDKAIFGAGSDLKIYHNGNNSFIDEVGTGILYIRAATDLRLTNADSSKLYANFEDGGASKLYYNNGLKLLTTSTGIDVTGTLTTSSTININSSSGYGNLELGGASGGFIDFKTPFSDDHDARIIYSGSFLQISTAGDEPILLKHNNVDKLVTSSAGIAITGRTLVSDDQTNDWIKQEVSGTTSTISLGNTESTGATAQWSYNRSSGLLSGNIGAAAGTNFMTVKGTGNIGFGTDDPDGKVHILKNSAGTVSAATDANTLVLEDTNTGMTFLGGNTSVTRIRFGDADSNARGQVFYNHNSDSFGFQTAGSTKLTLTQDGELGVGLTNPSDLLDVRGDGADTYIRVGSDSGAGSDTARIGKIDSNKDFIIQASVGTTSSNTIFKRNTTVEVARFDTSGNFGLGTSSPDTIMEIVDADPVLTIRDTSTGVANASAILRLAESGASDTLGNHFDIGLANLGILSFGYSGDGTAATEQMQLVGSTGNLVLTTNPSSLYFGDTSSGSFVKGTNTGGYLILGTSNTERARVTTTGLGIGTTTADLLSIAFDGDISSDYTAFDVDIGKASGSAITNLKGINVDLASADITGGDEITNLYGAYINNSTAGGSAGVITNWWGIYVPAADADRTDNPVSAYFGDSVGIGTDDPQAPLHARNGSSGVSSYTAGTRAIIEGTATTYLTIAAPNTSLSGILFADPDDSDDGYIKYDHSQSGVMDFGTAGSTRLRIDDEGNVLIGKTTHDTNNTAGVDITAEGAVVATGSSSVSALFNRTTSDGTVVLLRRQNVTVGSISVTGSATAYNTSSDYRLKENVNYDFNALDRVSQLKPARFNFIADADTTVDGFLAHEVSDIVPEAIHGEKDAVDGEGNPEYQGIDQSKLVPLLTKAIQEQQTIIEDLKTRIEALEG
jgi:hypothetical protein